MSRKSNDSSTRCRGESAAALLVVNAEGEIIEIDDAFCILTGFAREELLGECRSFPFCPEEFIPEESLARWWEVDEDKSERGMIFRHKNGSILLVRLLSESSSPGGENRWTVSRYAGNRIYSPERGREEPAGREEDGAPDRVEYRRLVEKYLRSFPPEAMTYLLSDIVHDLNNIIYGITSMTTLALMDFEKTGGTKSDLEGILEATEKAGDYIRKLQQMGDEAFPRFKEESMDEIFHSLTWLLRQALPPGITVDCRPPDSIPPLRIDRGQVENALFTVCLEAVSDSPAGGVLRLEAGVVDLAGADIDSFHDLTPGKYCRITISGGAARTREEMDTLLDPVCPGWQPGGGLNLRLLVPYRTAREHRGTLALRNVPDQGMVTELYLPVYT
ncbi:MAG: PAS domain S-box protein [Candidatus Krumholzibacteriota bacterium]|nr:PAS domain S-box protein [Candidatus Krumholzibacteriota bacterium]